MIIMIRKIIGPLLGHAEDRVERPLLAERA